MPYKVTLWSFAFTLAIVAFGLLLFAVGMAGYELVTRPALERHAQWVAADLLPEPSQCTPMMLNAQLDRLRARGLGDGITLVPNTPGAVAASGFVWSRPFDALLANQVQARFGENVQVDSSMSSVSLTFNCGGQRMSLRLSRSATLGAEPDLALVLWFIALLVGAVTMAALLSRAMTIPLRKLIQHLMATPLGNTLSAAPNTGIVELNELATEIDALRRRASNAVASRGALLMGLSHDLRAPLARLRLTLDTTPSPNDADMTEMRHDVYELQDALDEFMRAANAMASPVAAEGAQQAWSRLKRTFPDSRLSFHGAPDAKCPPLNAAALVRVASNLIDNALRHTSGPVRVSWQSGFHWQLCVHDTGTGIPETDLPSAFQPFQHHSRASDLMGGFHAGLGLSLAQIICEHNGWQLLFGQVALGGWRICVAASVV